MVKHSLDKVQCTHTIFHLLPRARNLTPIGKHFGFIIYLLKFTLAIILHDNNSKFHLIKILRNRKLHL